MPHVLVVQTGTEVTFPNSDSVSHHVYSFSPTKAFELPLYKGDLYPPVVFDKAGIVVVGCNIHDSMLGYIRVVDTPHFAVTNEQGVALIDGIPSGDYGVEVWTPRVRPAELPAAQQVAVASDAAKTQVRITGRLAPRARARRLESHMGPVLNARRCLLLTAAFAAAPACGAERPPRVLLRRVCRLRLGFDGSRQVDRRRRR